MESYDIKMSAQALLQDLRGIIDAARGSVAATANYEQTMLYWHVGKRINCEVLGEERALYGKKIVATVLRQCRDNCKSIMGKAVTTRKIYAV